MDLQIATCGLYFNLVISMGGVLGRKKNSFAKIKKMITNMSRYTAVMALIK